MKPVRSLALTCLAVASLGAQTLSPREIFYGAAPSAPKAPRTRPRPKPVTPAPARTPASDPLPVSTTTPSAPEARVPDTNVYRTVAARPLGLKYSILKRDGTGEYSEVAPASTFTSDEQIRVRVESNDSGYLFVVMQGSSGKWQVLFPSAAAGSNNKIEAGKPYDVPATKVFTFDERSGTEKLFVVLSRQPEQDLEGLTYSLQKAKPKRNEISGPMIASNMPVQDDVVQRLRNTYSRDLLIESVDDSNKPPSVAEKTVMSHAKITGEKAVYIVNPSMEPNARVVADIELHHAGKP